jgi:hypothetical protein
MYFLRPLSLKAHLAMVPDIDSKPLSKASLCGYKNGYSGFVLFKPGKFLNNDLIPVGLKG